VAAYEADELVHLVAADGITPALVRTAAACASASQVAEQQAGTVACIEEGFPTSPPTSRERFISAVATALPGAALCINQRLGAGSRHGRRVPPAGRCPVAAGVPCWIDSYGKPMLAALAGANPPALVKPKPAGVRWRPAGLAGGARSCT